MYTTCKCNQEQEKIEFSVNIMTVILNISGEAVKAGEMAEL